MCGFVGILGAPGQSGELLAKIASDMASSIRHRGPDHSAHWLEPQDGVGLAHNRLAIVELSPAGDQPMHSESGRYVLIYNGEIYNHLSVRRQLSEAGAELNWRGNSDTETLLAAIEHWGLDAALERIIGMFAFALWDRREKRLSLARDRLGEKPLYYGWQGSGSNSAFLFGSELKALARHPSFQREVEREALSLFMRYDYVPAPYSIYKGIKKLLPGTYATVSLAQPEPAIRTYWSGSAVAEAGVANPLAGNPLDTVDRLETLLRQAVQQQMMADVPLGAFLSGGLDSSLIVALMQAQSSRPVKTFTIGFQEEAYNEAEHAKAVAGHLGTNHTELYVSSSEATAVIPRLAEIYDEPFADSSQIPTFLVSQLARRHVTVSLSGDAGDELFGGYNRYALVQKYWAKLSRVPRPVRTMAGRAALGVSPTRWDAIAAVLSPVLPSSLHMRLPGEKIHKSARLLGSGSVQEVYRHLVSTWPDPAGVVLDGFEPPTLLDGQVRALAGLSEIERMMALDMLTYLPDDILAKVDRAAMSVSLETRVPFLDHRVVEFAWRMPLELKLRDGKTKWALREVLDRYVPAELMERPKMGFGVPIDHWLRGPLRDWADELLSPEHLKEDGYFNPAVVRSAWEAHQRGEANTHHQLWSVLMFQQWLRAIR